VRGFGEQALGARSDDVVIPKSDVGTWSGSRGPLTLAFEDRSGASSRPSQEARVGVVMLTVGPATLLTALIVGIAAVIVRGGHARLLPRDENAVEHAG